jgi:hypothetical protein
MTPGRVWNELLRARPETGLCRARTRFHRLLWRANAMWIFEEMLMYIRVVSSWARVG